MRRGQLLSLDALIALVMVVFILSAVTTASENLSSGLSSMLSWYERTNIANNMLDVLVNSPGEPENWSENMSIVVVPGLRSSQGRYLDYRKIEALFNGIHSGNPALLNALWNLSGHNNFQLSLYLPNISIFANLSVLQSIISNYAIYNGSCYLGGAGDVIFTNSTLIPCSSFTRSGAGDLTVYGSLFVNGTYLFTGAGDAYVNQTLCVVGNLTTDGAGDTQTGSYLAVENNLVTSGAGDIIAGGDVYVGGYILDTGAGTVVETPGNLYVGKYIKFTGAGEISVGKNLYIFGNTTVTPLIYLDGAGEFIVDENLYIQVEGMWFGVTGDPFNESNWHVWTGTSWVSASSLVLIYYDSVYVNVNNQLVKVLYVPGAIIISIDSSGARLLPPPEAFPEAPCFSEAYSSNTINIPNVNVFIIYNYSSLYSPVTSTSILSISMINGTVIENQDIIETSKEHASWVGHSEFDVVILKSIYSREYNLTIKDFPKEIYSGTLDQPITDNLQIVLPSTNITGNFTLIASFTGEYTGYSAFVFEKKGTAVFYASRIVIPSLNYSSTPKNCRVTVLSSNRVLIPLSCLLPQLELNSKIVFSIWLYDEKGFNWIYIKDLGILGVVLKPAYLPGKINLWVWG